MRDPDAIELRDATAADVRALVGLINRAFAVERSFVDGDRTDAAAIADLLGRGGFLLAEADGAPLGCVYLEPRGERAYFGMLSIDPRAQRRGLGRALIVAAEDRARSGGARWMDIKIVDLRSELPPYYAGLGYAETGREPYPEPERLKRPCRFVLMSKRLDPATP